MLFLHKFIFIKKKKKTHNVILDRPYLSNNINKPKIFEKKIVLMIYLYCTVKNLKFHLKITNIYNKILILNFIFIHFLL
jgi:hypothetical protein